MTNTPPAIRVDDVVRTFGAVRATDHVSFEVRHGEVFGLLGHNGAGKTTLIRLINGLLRPDSGSIRTLGMDPVAQGDQVRARTGVLTEYPALDEFLTPAENLRVYADIHGVDETLVDRIADALLTRLGLQEHLDQPARSLSAGLKQRLALARALVHDPQVLLLDEPTSNLDPLAARGVRDLVLELTREHGRTVLLSTHNLAEAQTMCDRVAIIQRGRILAVGSLDDLSREVDQGTVHVTVARDDLRVAAATLEAVGATDVAILDPVEAVTGRLGTSLVPDAVAALTRAGVRVHAVVPQSPTLEDVYVALHGATDRTPHIPAGLA